MNNSRRWTFSEASAFINALRPLLQERGWCIGLTGSVLFNGESEKDLDIIVYPLDASADPTLIALDEAFNEYPGMRPHRSVEDVTAYWRSKGSSDTKHVEIWTCNGKRVDVFVLR